MTFLRFPFHYSCSYSNNDVNAEILKSYTGSGDSLPALVLVNHYKVSSIMVSLCSLTLEVLPVQIAMSISLSSKDWFKRYSFAAGDKLTTSLRSGLFRVNQTYNQLATQCRFRPEKCDKSLNHF